MDLRDCIASDIHNVFFNEKEFAVEANIDGEMIKVVIDEDLLKELKLKNDGEGLYMVKLLFHVPKNDFPFFPKRGQDIRFNDEDYYIAEVKDNEGVYTIMLEEPHS